jgi:GntR family transcriptional regulator
MSTLYSVVAQKIINDIKASHFPIGSMLPSEPELAARYKVSRSTIRAALDRLQSAGFVSRRRGAGTLVKAERAGLRYTHSMVAANDLMQFAGDSAREVISIEDIIADESLARRLDNRPGRPWTRIGQLRWVDGETLPVCWTDMYLDQKFKDVSEDIRDYRGLAYNLIEERFNVFVNEILQTIEASGIPEDVAGILSAETGSHALLLTRRYMDTENKPIVVTVSVLPSDRYKSHIRLIRTG